MLEDIDLCAAGVEKYAAPEVSISILIFNLFQFLYTKW